jgi:spore maturation protein CgeB
MNIAFYGSSLVSSYWNGACTYYRGLLKELARLGHSITFYEPDAYERQQHRDMADPGWARVVVYPATPGGWQRALEAGARDADLLVKASGVGVFDAELEQALPQASARAIRAYWDVDAPATLEAMAVNPDHPLHSAIAAYDVVFTYGGGDPVVRGYSAVGARLCVPIYNALDAETHYAVAPRPDFACDLSFLGNRLPDRESRVEEYFLKAAELSPGRKFLLGGSGWESKSLPPNVRHLGHVGTADHNAFFCSGLATLNVNRDSMARFGFSPPTRVFEAAGAGACLITDSWTGIDEFLEPDTEILIANNGEEVAAQLGNLNASRARAIGDAAQKRILARHTYAHRARQVSKILDGMVLSREAAE